MLYICIYIKPLNFYCFKNNFIFWITFVAKLIESWRLNIFIEIVENYNKAFRVDKVKHSLFIQKLQLKFLKNNIFFSAILEFCGHKMLKPKILTALKIN